MPQTRFVLTISVIALLLLSSLFPHTSLAGRKNKLRPSKAAQNSELSGLKSKNNYGSLASHSTDISTGVLSAKTPLVSLHSNSTNQPAFVNDSSKDIQIQPPEFILATWLSSKERLTTFQEMERACFSPKGLSEKCSVLKANIKNHAGSLLGSAAMFYATSCALENFTGVGGSTANISAMILMGFTQDLLGKLGKAFTCKLEPQYAVELLQKYLTEKSKSLVEFLPHSLRDKVLEIDREILSSINDGTGHSSLNLIRLKERVLLSLPISTLAISEETEEKRNQVKNLIERTLPENHSVLRTALYMIEDNSRLSSVRELPDGTPAAGTKVVLFLNGPRGTGKTEFVRELARTTGQHLCEIRLSELENPQQLVGTGNFSTTAAQDEGTGKIIDCLLRAGHLNPIIFLEEATNTLGAEAKKSVMEQSQSEIQNAWKKMAFMEILKSLFDRDPKSATYQFSGLMKIPFDISRVTWILAGNFPLHKDLNSGGRVTTVYFGPLTRAQKQEAALEAKRSALTKLEGDPQLSKRVSSYLNEAIIQFILKKDYNRFIPGARIIKDVIQKAASHIAHTRSSISESELKQFIGRTYESVDTRDTLEKKTDALSIAVSEQERNLRQSNSENEQNSPTSNEISKAIELLRDTQEAILIRYGDTLPEAQALKGIIENLTRFIVEHIVNRDKIAHSDDEIETFTIPEKEMKAKVEELFS